MNVYIQQTPEWLELRRKKIGASDAPCIMGVSPWKTPYELWLEKLTGKEQSQTWAMKEGIRKEEEARTEFEKQTGIIVFPKVLISDKYDWMMASLDGIDIEHENAVEIKCPGKTDHECALSGKIPEKYYPQLQHQMCVANLKKIFYFSYGYNSSKLIEIYRDDDYISKMLKEEIKFLECLNNHIPPELSEKDYQERNDEIWQQTAQKWLSLSSQIKSLEKEEQDVRKILENMSGQSNTKGAGISVSKIIRRGNIDYSSIPELHEINLEKYRKENIVITRIHKEKGEFF